MKIFHLKVLFCILLLICFSDLYGAKNYIELNPGVTADALKTAIDNDPSLLEQKGENNYDTPLISAIKKNRLDLAEVLIAKGADVNAKGQDDETPLSVALRKLEGEVVQKEQAPYIFLIEYLMNNSATFDDTTLNYAVSKIYSDGVLKGLEKIIDFTPGNSIVFDKIAEFKKGFFGIKKVPMLFGLISAEKSQTIEVMKKLIAKGANVNVRDSDGKTALHVVMEHLSGAGDDVTIDILIKMLELLMNNGADPSLVTNVNKKTPFGCVLNKLNKKGVREGLKKIIELLPEGSSAISAPAGKNDKTTLLHWAADIGDKKLCKTLIKKGAEVTVKNNNGETPFNIADKNYMKAIKSDDSANKITFRPIAVFLEKVEEAQLEKERLAKEEADRLEAEEKAKEAEKAKIKAATLIQSAFRSHQAQKKKAKQIEKIKRAEEVKKAAAAKAQLEEEARLKKERLEKEKTKTLLTEQLTTLTTSLGNLKFKLNNLGKRLGDLRGRLK